MKHAIFAAAVALLAPHDTPSTRPEDGPFPAHRVVGNVYYVGSKQLASFLITTDQGHILINSGFDQTVPLIQASIEHLGFRFQDVKILLTSHAHGDHVGGHALVKRLTGARVMVMTGDDDVVRSGGKGDVEPGREWEGSPVDQVLHDRDKVRLGSVVLVAHLTPGHTKGTTTWTLKVKEGAQLYDVVIIGGGGPNPDYQLVGNLKYPTISEDFARSYRILKALPCDIPLGPHGNYYGLEAKYARLQADSSRNPFVDAETYRQMVIFKEKEFEAMLARQRGLKPEPGTGSASYQISSRLGPAGSPRQASISNLLSR
ncbi:MAG: subclass B3 metallo-beta-lactamase [Gemmatimonadota bacterium]